MRRPIIAGNWKMNKTIAESKRDAKAVSACASKDVDIIIFPQFMALAAVKEAISGTAIKVGAQDIWHEDAGAFTGEISASMVKETSQYSLVGHSERRQLFGETDAIVNLKVKACTRNSLTPVLCVGETLEEREKEKTLKVVTRQLKSGLDGFDPAHELIIAYEPVWAIGTGKTASSAQAQEVHAAIRRILLGLFGEKFSQSTRILYGGSVKPDNIAELLSKEDIDGGLVGGASLSPDSFIALIKHCREI